MPPLSCHHGCHSTTLRHCSRLAVIMCLMVQTLGFVVGPLPSVIRTRMATEDRSDDAVGKYEDDDVVGATGDKYNYEGAMAVLSNLEPFPSNLELGQLGFAAMTNVPHPDPAKTPQKGGGLLGNKTIKSNKVDVENQTSKTVGVVLSYKHFKASFALQFLVGVALGPVQLGPSFEYQQELANAKPVRFNVPARSGSTNGKYEDVPLKSGTKKLFITIICGNSVGEAEVTLDNFPLKDVHKRNLILVEKQDVVTLL